MASTVPPIDTGARQRLSVRFGSGVEAWFDELPGVLAGLAERWQLEFGEQIPRGSVSVVFKCRMADGQAAVLKASPDLERLVSEAAALRSWQTTHSPAVLALDEQLGALLIEAIEPGTPLAVSTSYPSVDGTIELLSALHASGRPDEGYLTVGQRSANLFESSRRLYELDPELVQVVPPDLYERGNALSARLARSSRSSVLLHGDLTPSNILDGGSVRGLVAIDPAPCVGDPAFDAIDLVLWQADDLETIETRCARLAATPGIDAERLHDWCRAQAAMAALETASNGGPQKQIQTFLELAAQTPSRI